MKIYSKEYFNFMLPSKQEIIRLRNCILKEKIVLTSFDEASNDIHSENKDT